VYPADGAGRTKSKVGQRTEDVVAARAVQAEAVDLGDDARRVRIEHLARATLTGRIAGVGTGPWLTIGLARGVGQQVRPVLRTQRAAIDRPGERLGLDFAELPVAGSTQPSGGPYNSLTSFSIGWAENASMNTVTGAASSCDRSRSNPTSGGASELVTSGALFWMSLADRRRSRSSGWGVRLAPREVSLLGRCGSQWCK